VSTTSPTCSPSVPHTRASSQGRAALDPTYGLGKLHSHIDNAHHAERNQALRGSPTLGNGRLYVATSDIPGAGRGLRTLTAIEAGAIVVVCSGRLCHLDDIRQGRLRDPTCGDHVYRLPRSPGMDVDGATLANCVENLSPEEHAQQLRLPAAQRRRLQPLSSLGSWLLL